MIATGVLALTGREPFEVVGPVSAVAFPIAIVSWVELWRAVRDDTPRLAALPVAAAAASPLLVMVYSENQVPHLVGLAVLPFALASAVRFARAPGARTLVVAAIASAGTLGVYTGLLPWLLAGLPAAVVAGRPPGPGRLRTALLPIGALAVAAAVAGVLPLRQAVRFVGAAGGETGVDAPSVHASDGVLVASGAAVRRAFAGYASPDWREIAAGLVVLAAVAVAAVVVVRARGRGAAGGAGWAALGLLLATGVVVVNFLLRDDSGGYGIWRAWCRAGPSAPARCWWCWSRRGAAGRCGRRRWRRARPCGSPRRRASCRAPTTPVSRASGRRTSRWAGPWTACPRAPTCSWRALTRARRRSGCG